MNTRTIATTILAGLLVGFVSSGAKAGELSACLRQSYYVLDENKLSGIIWYLENEPYGVDFTATGIFHRPVDRGWGEIPADKLAKIEPLLNDLRAAATARREVVFTLQGDRVQRIAVLWNKPCPTKKAQGSGK